MHQTTYNYSSDVFLEPQVLRLYPRANPNQKVLDFVLDISPQPAGISVGVDIWGNTFHQVWFSELHKNLTIKSTSIVQTMRNNPFDYYLPDHNRTIPITLDAIEKEALKGSLTRAHETGPVDHVRDMASRFKEESKGSVTMFLIHLNTWLFEHIGRIERTEPGIYGPDMLLDLGEGACRDIAVLFIEVCRAAGLPARFVSGYHEGDDRLIEGDLHAWAEVYLPGIGWRGYDPSYGLAVADRHIVLTAAPYPERTMPVTGNYRGSDAWARFDYSIRLWADVQ